MSRNPPVAEYTAPQMKKSVAGYGKAGKPEAVQEMVKRLLKLPGPPAATQQTRWAGPLLMRISGRACSCRYDRPVAQDQCDVQAGAELLVLCSLLLLGSDEKGTLLRGCPLGLRPSFMLPRRAPFSSTPLHCWRSTKRMPPRGAAVACPTPTSI